ncbi:hypothetical protein [Herbaspirillum sp. RV1423]|uniref:hypothetical protein n=1 Tax=Herbaspirillum sp. RV1423 TaxID=1443993 RepID=UPI0012DCB399|nr:hypothetical protein [Herbaspirillum sp. RV1423]
MLTALLMMLPPALFYWQYRHRRWWSLVTGAAVFILGLDHLMLKDKGNIGQTFVGATLLFGPLYFVLTTCVEWSRHLGRTMCGNAMVSLPASERLTLAGLAISAHLFLFLLANVFDILNPPALNIVSDVINCLFHLPQPVNLLASRDVLNMLLAALPTLMLIIVLHAWLRRRRARSLDMPWLLYFAAMPGVLGSALLLGALATSQ